MTESHHHQTIHHVVPPDSVGKRVATVLQALTAVGAIVALILVVVTSRNESRDAKRLVTKIQASRVETQYNTCQESNSRHDATVKTLLAVYKQELQHPPAGFTKQDIQTNLNGNLFIINALAPRTVSGTGTLAQREYRGCMNRAHALTRTSG